MAAFNTPETLAQGAVDKVTRLLWKGLKPKRTKGEPEGRSWMPPPGRHALLSASERRAITFTATSKGT